MHPHPNSQLHNPSHNHSKQELEQQEQEEGRTQGQSRQRRQGVVRCAQRPERARRYVASGSIALGFALVAPCGSRGRR